MYTLGDAVSVDSHKITDILEKIQYILLVWVYIELMNTSVLCNFNLKQCYDIVLKKNCI